MRPFSMTVVRRALHWQLLPINASCTPLCYTPSSCRSTEHSTRTISLPLRYMSNRDKVITWKCNRATRIPMLLKHCMAPPTLQQNQRLEENLIQSYIGRVTYDYQGKYLLNASIRRDGLSVFAAQHKFQNFPAVSVGWKLDQENFMANSKSISELKLRAGYGLTGNNGLNLGNYPSQAVVQANQAFYPFDNVVGGANGSSIIHWPIKTLHGKPPGNSILALTWDCSGIK